MIEASQILFYLIQNQNHCCQWMHRLDAVEGWRRPLPGLCARRQPTHWRGAGSNVITVRHDRNLQYCHRRQHRCHEALGTAASSDPRRSRQGHHVWLVCEQRLCTKFNQFWTWDTLILNATKKRTSGSLSHAVLCLDYMYCSENGGNTRWCNAPWGHNWQHRCWLIHRLRAGV